jgi:hypothetical protein
LKQELSRRKIRDDLLEVLQRNPLVDRDDRFRLIVSENLAVIVVSQPLFAALPQASEDSGCRYEVPSSPPGIDIEVQCPKRKNRSQATLADDLPR